MSTSHDAEQPPLPEPRRLDANKGDFGHVLVIAGSRRMIGAAALCSTAASRAGAGLVTLACPAGIQLAAAPLWPAALSVPLPETRDGSIALGAWKTIEPLLGKITAVAIGPGLSRNRSTEFFVHRVIERTALPIVIDADALNALASRMDILESRREPTILTPHPGEMSRLTGQSVRDVQSDRRGTARLLAERYHCTVVLKGAGTVVASAGRTYINSSGNPYMAGGGAGDVLTGMIAALLAQKLSPFDAARTAVYWHGLAGDRIATAVGPGAVTPLDILEQLKRSGDELDWYNEELRLEEEEVFDPDREETEL